MIHPANIASFPKTPTPPVQAPASPEPKPPVKSEDGVGFRDVAAIGAGAVAGVAGGVYGLGEGLIKGGIAAYPKHIKRGATVGQAVLAPVGKLVGGTAAVATVGMVALAAPILTTVAAADGFVSGTISGALKAGETEMPKAIDAGQKWGASAFGTALKAVGAAIGGTIAGLVVLPTILYPPVGKELIPQAFNKGTEIGGNLGSAAGEALGTGVGTVGGAIVGGAVSTYKGLPEGFATGKQAGKECLSLIPNIPTIAKELWTTGVEGGGDVAGKVGSVVGGTAGFATATGATVVSGIDKSLERASDWAGSTANFVRGDKAE